MDQDRLETLIELHLSGVASSDERAELEEQLRSDPRSRVIFWHEAELNAQLMAAGEVQSHRRSVPNKIDPQRKMVGFLLAGCVLFGLAVTVFLAVIVPRDNPQVTKDDASIIKEDNPITEEDDPSRPSREVVAEVTVVYEAVWTKGQVGAFRGAYLVAGRKLQLDAGLIEVTFRDGTRVVIEGPAAFRVETNSSGTLERGKLTARVGDEGKGFVVHTEHATVTDLGTEFGVEIGDEANFVAVHEGVVEVAPTSEGGKPRAIRVTEGMVVSADNPGEVIATNRSRRSSERRLPLISGLIAHYEFENAATPGFDTTGNYTGSGPSVAVGQDSGDPRRASVGDVTNSGGLAVPAIPTGSDYTITMWYKNPNNSVWGSFATAGNDDADVVLLNNGTFSLGSYPYDHGRTFQNSGYDISGTQERWTHLGYVVTSGSGQFYIDGSPVGRTVTGSAAPITNFGDFIVGGGNAAEFLDDIRVYNVAKSAQDIADIFQFAE